VPRLTHPRFLQQIAARPARAVFFLHGAEEHLREVAVHQVVDGFLEPSTRDFNFDQLRGPDVTPEQVASLLATPPMMAEHRVIVIREMQGLSQRAREAVEAAVEAPPPGLVLVITGQIPRDSKAKFYSTLERNSAAVEFPALDANDLPGWLMERAREEHGRELELDAARALAVAIGPQLGVLASELDKLSSFCQDRTEITLEDVRAVGGYVPRVDRWGWFDAVGERRCEEALRLLPELLESGESAVGLVIGIGGQLARIGLAVAGGKEALDRELNARQRWLAGRISAAATKWTMDELDDAMAELLRTDRLLKTASLSDRQAMEELLMRLMHRLRERSAA
jgi:DNA polymerase-3 subunit delta